AATAAISEVPRIAHDGAIRIARCTAVERARQAGAAEAEGCRGRHVLAATTSDEARVEKTVGRVRTGARDLSSRGVADYGVRHGGRRCGGVLLKIERRDSRHVRR